MKSATSKVVTALDVSVVVMAIVSGVYCGLFSLNDTLELNDRLNKVRSRQSKVHPPFICYNHPINTPDR